MSLVTVLPWHLPYRDMIKGTPLWVPTTIILGEVKKRS
jgi:hypothetical protein